MVNILRTWGPIGRYLKNVPNHVPEEQKFFAARAKVPTHLKRDSDGRVFYFTVGLLSVGGLMFAKGAVDILTGSNKRQ